MVATILCIQIIALSSKMTFYVCNGITIKFYEIISFLLFFFYSFLTNRRIIEHIDWNCWLLLHICNNVICIATYTKTIILELKNVCERWLWIIFIFAIFHTYNKYISLLRKSVAIKIDINSFSYLSYSCRYCLRWFTITVKKTWNIVQFYLSKCISHICCITYMRKFDWIKDQTNKMVSGKTQEKCKIIIT